MCGAPFREWNPPRGPLRLCLRPPACNLRVSLTPSIIHQFEKETSILSDCNMRNLVTALLVFCGCAAAADNAAIAIRNAKIVTVSGSVISKGTVVVRNGLIQEV